jgi:hypothetical protein
VIVRAVLFLAFVVTVTTTLQEPFLSAVMPAEDARQ